MKKLPSLLPAAVLVFAAYPACAQQLPDAGRLLQENSAPPLQAPRPAPGVAVESGIAAPAKGGVQVVLRQVSLDGNSTIDEATLLAALGDVTGRAFDFAGLDKLAARLTAYYQAAGFPFARAILPQQDLSSGHLRIRVIEGRYGRIAASGPTPLARPAEAFLDRLTPGMPIESKQLERVTLILDDLPGIKTTPTIRPGQEFGTATCSLTSSASSRNRARWPSTIMATATRAASAPVRASSGTARLPSATNFPFRHLSPTNECGLARLAIAYRWARRVCAGVLA